MPSITFQAEQVRRVLVEGFDWLADRFDSDHWKLTDNQADMLAGPTSALLGGVWSKLAAHLPDMLVAMPGATAFVFAASVVIVPKVGQQMAISRERKRDGRAPQPQMHRPVQRPDGHAVGPITPGGFDVNN